MSKALKAERVRAQGLPAGFERPLLVSYQRLPGPGFMAKLMSMLLPYMILIFSLLGAMYPAIDLGAGEKERGTLETLLSAPVERQALVMGKFGVVLAASVVSALLATASLYVSIKAGALGKFAPEQVSFGPGEAIAAFAVVIPTACIFSSLLMVLSVFARSFKEAQSYASPLQMFIILPAFVSFIPGLELSPATALVPVMNVSLALKAIFTGELGMHVLDIALLLASSVVLAGVLLWFAARWFLREQVLFRS
ncbi:MAG: ABC transporter permease [Deltaproteobacteria bacterium]|nr:MAG: ABC transporter permease [Deltaproteobacteria bacterium]